MGRTFAKTFPTFAKWAADPRTHRAWSAAVRIVRAIATAIFRTLTTAPIVGIAYLTGITYFAMRGPMISDDEKLLGSSQAHVIDMVWTRYADDFRAMLVELVVISAVLGALLGSVAGALVAMAARWEQRTPWRLERALWTLVVAASIQAGSFAWSMSRYPQLYERAWNFAGGLRRAFQTLVSSRLDPLSVGALAVAFVVACAIAPSLVRRARSSSKHAAGEGESRETGAIARGVVALAIVIAAFTFLPPRASIAPHVRSEHPNVLILAADSLRDDRLGPALMPTVARLAEKGTRFTHAYVTTPRTLPSWTTMLTGEWPHHHGIRSTFPRFEERTRARDTIVSRFAKAGYTTGVVTDHVGDVFSLMDYGFTDILAPPDETFREYVRQGILRRARPLLPFLHSPLGRWVVPSMREVPVCDDAGFLADDVVDAIRREREHPFFLVGFFGAAHVPYASPSPYFKRFTDPKFEGELKYDKLVWDPPWIPTDAETRQMRALYDGAVTSFDDAVARVLTELDRAEIAERTIVVILADHGESLLESDRGYGHGSYVAGDEPLHIPLVIFDPRQPTGHAVPDLVRDVDLAPTLCELAGVQCPDALDGASLGGAWSAQPIAPRLAYAETDVWFNEGIPAQRIPYPGLIGTVETDTLHGDDFVLRPNYDVLVTFAKHRMVFDGRWKLVYEPLPDAPRYLLFDTQADPLQVTDVSADHPAELARLRELLWTWMLEDPAMENRHGWLAPRGVHIGYVDGDGLR